MDKPNTMNKRRSTIRKLLTMSPRMSRSLGTAGSRYPMSVKSDAKTHDTMLETCSTFGGLDTLGHKSVRLENTYKTAPDNKFSPKIVEDTVSDVINDYLNDVIYDYHEVKLLSQQLSNKILDSVKKLGFSRYKYVVNVSIGSLQEQATVQLSSRCLWNKETDSFVTVRFENKSLFAVANIYGLYFD